MNKKFLSAILFGALTAASTSTFVSCSDYDDDIEYLQEQITANKATIDQIQALLDKGITIESVTPNGEGVLIKTSDGGSYQLTNGKDGKDGIDGKDGLNGQDGKDGVDGKDGLNGQDGKDGVDGKDGKDGLNGQDGKDGVDGKDGLNGQDGKDGVDGKDGLDGKDGKDGVDGRDGKDATVWTIGDDGYWYQNGAKTGYKAIGIDGKNGADGKDGLNGKDGKDGADGKDGLNGQDGKDGADGKDGLNGQDGKDGADGKDGLNGQDGKDGLNGQDGKDGENGGYYVPNITTGYFDFYKDGELVTAGTAENGAPSWKASQKSVNAVVSGNTLTLTNVNGNETPIVLNLGQALGSVAFVPEVVSSTLPYATTTDEFYHLTEFLSENKYNEKTYDFIWQNGFNKSNVVNMLYRLNPSEAYVEGAIASFVNRNVETRGVDGDKYDLITIKDTVFSKGTVSVNATMNSSKLQKNAIAALQVWAGQNPVTSDFIHITSEEIDVVLADSGRTKVGEPAKTFYARTKAIVSGKNEETDKFVKQFVGLNDNANYQLLYNGEIDLKKYVGLYSDDELNWLSKLGFVGMSYEFSLPKEFKADDTQNTNQQWFVKEKSEGVIVVDGSHLTEGLTPAIGRTPIVRVDAFLTDNAGNKKLVASSYIKIEIVNEIKEEVTPDDKPAISSTIGDTKAFEYHSLNSGNTIVAQKDWTSINNDIYGKTGLTSQTFWNYYGGDSDKYDVVVTTTGKNGKVVTLNQITGTMGTNTVVSADGIMMEILLNNGATQTSNIKVGVNNLVKTENTYKDVDGKGAEYKITITIKSDNVKSKGNVVLTQTFYVKEDCKSFTYNEYYHMSGYNGNSGDYILVKGQLNNNTWEMSTAVNEHFKMINNKNIFEYYNTVQNVSDLNFNWAVGVTGVSSAPASGANPANDEDVIKLTAAMTKREEIKNLEYHTTLINGEKCDFNYNIVFINPFIAGKADALKINGNEIGTATVKAAPEVLVLDNSNKNIYSWVNNKLTLSSLATGTYKVAEPTVKYAFDQNSAYKNLISQLGEKASIKVDENTGEITWTNQGSTLVKDVDLVVKATVTFENLSIVTCDIPVKLAK